MQTYVWGGGGIKRLDSSKNKLAIARNRKYKKTDRKKSVQSSLGSLLLLVTQNSVLFMHITNFPYSFFLMFSNLYKLLCFNSFILLDCSCIMHNKCVIIFRFPRTWRYLSQYRYIDMRQEWEGTPGRH